MVLVPHPVQLLVGSKRNTKAPQNLILSDWYILISPLRVPQTFTYFELVGNKGIYILIGDYVGIIFAGSLLSTGRWMQLIFRPGGLQSFDECPNCSTWTTENDSYIIRNWDPMSHNPAFDPHIPRRF